MFTLLLACTQAPAGPSLRLDFGSDAFYDAPFPAEGRDLSGFPNPEGVPLVEQLLALLEDSSGYGRSSATFFASERPLDPESLPTVVDTVTPQAAVFLMDVDPDSPEQGRRLPLLVHTQEQGGDFGSDNLLVLLPVQGVPLRSNTRYAAVVTQDLRTVSGEPLGQAPALTQLLNGETPEGLPQASLWTQALDALALQGVDTTSVAALTVFTTGVPERGMQGLRAAAPAIEPPRELALTQIYDGYCVYEGLLDMPVYQQGEAPYLTEGGGIEWVAGVPVLDHMEAARVLFTVPRVPAGELPTAVFIRTGGGGDRPLVDRGLRDSSGASEPGTGPATWLSEVGYAGVSVDGPHGGIRNVTGSDEQFLMFNIQNPSALRDNVRQSALELALLPALLADLHLDASDCPGVGGEVSFGELALIGHSMGATIAPLTLAVAPEYSRLILSGAGGSWIHNVVYKLSPLEVRPLAEAMLGYDAGDLNEWDPVLSLLQWAGEPADPPLYAKLALDTPRDILMVQGIVDTYILPPIANSASLSLGLDLVGPSLDIGPSELQGMTPLEDLLPLARGQQLSYPAGFNHEGHTRLVSQHPEDGVEDGHEVFFQTLAPQCQAKALLLGEEIPECL